MIQPIPGKPGWFLDPNTGKEVFIGQTREDDKYDTIALSNDATAGNVPAGTTAEFFRDINGKDLLDTNFKTPRRLNAQEAMIVRRIGAYVPHAVGAILVAQEDFKLIYENSSLVIKVNGQTISEGPLVKYQSGYGLAGAIGTAANTVVGTESITTNGVPSTAAALWLKVPQLLTDEYDVEATLRFDRRQWLTQNTVFGAAFAPNEAIVLQTDNGAGTTRDMPVLVKLFLHGAIKSPGTR